MAPYNLGKSLIFKFLIVILSFSASNISAQSLPDFSGIWLQDIKKSDDFYKNWDVKCTITQTPQSLTVINTFSEKGGEELAKHENSFGMDGKEVISEEGRTKKSVAWSADKKTLTTSNVKDYGGDPVGVKTSYTLSGDGLSLIVKTADINPLVDPVNQVFNKKQ